MTLGDLYPDVKLYSEVEKFYNYDWGRRGWEREMGGGSGRTYGKGWRGQRWQGDEDMGRSPEGVAHVKTTKMVGMVSASRNTGVDLGGGPGGPDPPFPM